MNRRNFMKAVGLVVAGASVSLNATASSGFIDSPPLIKEHCEVSFIPEYEPYTRRYATQVDMSLAEYFNLQDQSQKLNNGRFSIFTDAHRKSGFTADAGYLMFNPITAFFVGVDKCRATLIVDFKENEVGFGTVGWNSFIVDDTGGLVEVEIYQKTDFKAILSDSWVWTEIKEKV